MLVLVYACYLRVIDGVTWQRTYIIRIIGQQIVSHDTTYTKSELWLNQFLSQRELISSGGQNKIDRLRVNENVLRQKYLDNTSLFVE